MFRQGGILIVVLIVVLACLLPAPALAGLLPTAVPVPQLSPPALTVPTLPTVDLTPAPPVPTAGVTPAPAVEAAPAPASEPAPAARAAAAPGPAAGGLAAAPPAAPRNAPELQAPLVQLVLDSPLGPAPPVLGLLLLLLSAGLALERRRRQRRRERDLDAAKQEFLKVASHELRTPLTVLRGYLSMAGDGSLGRIPRELERVLPVMDGKLTDLERLVEQMLEAARIDEGQLRLQRVHLDLRDLARARTRLAHDRLSPRHVLVYQSAVEPVPVRADEKRLAAIVDALLDNALKYSPAGGQVICRVYRDAGSAFLEVTDEGLGIAPADLPRLFTRFGRIVTAENSAIIGTGLGLFLARELALAHDGDLGVSSEPGRGSTFTLRLPLSAPLWERLPIPGAHREGRRREPVSPA